MKEFIRKYIPIKFIVLTGLLTTLYGCASENPITTVNSNVSCSDTLVQATITSQYLMEIDQYCVRDTNVGREIKIPLHYAASDERIIELPCLDTNLLPITSTLNMAKLASLQVQIVRRETDIEITTPYCKNTEQYSAFVKFKNP